MMWLYKTLTYTVGSHRAKPKCASVREKSTCECELSTFVAYVKISLVIH